MELVFGQDRFIANWVAARVPYGPSSAEGFGKIATLGVLGQDGQALAGFVFHDYDEEHATMGISMAAENPRWCVPGVIRAALNYPFDQVGVNVLWNVIRADNKRALRMVKGLGFIQEGCLVDRFGKGQNAIPLRMQPREYRRLMRRFDRALSPERVAA